MDERGIVTLIGYTIFFVLFMILSYFMTELISMSTANVSNYISDPIALKLTDLLLPFIVLSIVVSYFIYSAAR